MTTTCKENGETCSCTEIPLKAQKGPHQVKWEANENESKWICRCGQSKKYPFCDNSHAQYNKTHGTNITPLEIKKEEKGKEKEVWICGCGHSKARPFCDGTHEKVKIASKEKKSKKEVHVWWPWTAATVILCASMIYSKVWGKH